MPNSRAAVIVGYDQPLVIQDIPFPELDGTAMMVRIDVSTLCGTDVHRWHGDHASDVPPFITGHEPCGFIEEMHAPRTDILGKPLHVGDRIVWSYVSCGHCYWCTVALQPCLCRGRASWGHNRSDLPPYLLGSCAEYMYVPVECQIIRVPETLSSATAAAASCAYRSVMHGFDRLGAIKSHETVLIQGSGPIGVFSAIVAREHGAKRVLLAGAPTLRLQVANRMGVDQTLNIETVTDETDRVAWVKDWTDGRGADIVIQAATGDAVPEGLDMLRDGGRFVSIGEGGSATMRADRFPHEMAFFTVRSGEPRHWLQAIDFLDSRSANYPFEEMISASYTLDDINDGISAMASLNVVKAAIYPHGNVPVSP